MAGQTPKTPKYEQPTSDRFGDIYRNSGEQIGITRPFYLGPLDRGAMGRSPQPTFMDMPNADTTPQANPAAVRAYTRNAPYMEKFMSDPQAIVLELYSLQEALREDPKDVVSEYRARVLRGALRDVFGMQAPDELFGYGVSRAQAPTTPNDITAGHVTTPKGYRY